MINRRSFLRTAAGVAAIGLSGRRLLAQEAKPASLAGKLPRWRGFNLLEKFTARRDGSAPAYKEEDFGILAEWGFDFVRLPMSYLCWSTVTDWLNIDQSKLLDIDKAIELGKQYKVHVNLNMHRAPGYCVNPPKEPKDLFTDPEALDACATHWRTFAARYKGIPSTQLSFDLLNEPSDIPEEKYIAVITRLVQEIRAADPNRLIIADGLKWGTKPVLGLAGLGIAQSTRGYAPMQISHFRANWITGSDKWAAPTWPLKLETETWDRQRLLRQNIEPWKALAAKGVGVHVGEWGAFQYTPHDVALAWMRDCLELWKEVGWGWSMWNLRGGFGLLDSNRSDIAYESHRGHKLDRKMLELLKEVG